MKFSSYNPAERDPSEAVAWLDDEGDLVITGAFEEHVCLSTEGFVVHYKSEDLKDYSREKLFFPGDSITITF